MTFINQICSFLIYTIIGFTQLTSCGLRYQQQMNKITQLTNEPSGHYLNVEQCFSPNSEWIVYDTRNDGSQIGSTAAIKMVNTKTSVIKELYTCKNQTEFGPGVGAVAFSPVADTVIFIHGIRNADSQKPYSFTRRTGVAIALDFPNQPIFMDARDITVPFTPGALRGGTHAHSWSGDGQFISFTYNDYILEQLSKTDKTISDLRTVGVMFPKKVNVDDDSSLENNAGEMFSVLISKVTENPKAGSDEIDKAFDECWIGKNGYIKPNGELQKRAIAFQGNVKDENGTTKTEIFKVDLPDDLSIPINGQPLQGTATTRPNVPLGIKQTRITYTKKGVLGPRHWLKASPNGQIITFLSKDDDGYINAFCVSPNGGEVKQLTFHKFDLQSGLNFKPDGQYVAYLANNAVFITNVNTLQSKQITPNFNSPQTLSGCAIWSPCGKLIAFNKMVMYNQQPFMQIFTVTVN